MAKKKRTKRTKSAKRRKPNLIVRLFLIAVSGLIIFTGAITGYMAWFILSDSLPDLESVEESHFNLSLATVAYTADAKVMGRYGYEVRTWVPFTSVDDTNPEKIPNHVVNALVSVEDRRFWNHWGVDLWRTFSAVTQTILGKLGLPFTRQGGSTITQQLARNLYNQEIGFDISAQRKLKEMAAAIQLERRYSKEEILEMYLNTVSFRHNSFGLEQASRTYYRKAASDINVQEAATLVAMLKGNTIYDPVRSPERSHTRRNIVLKSMVQLGHLDEEEYEQMKETPTPTSLQTASLFSSIAPYPAQYVQLRLQEILREVNQEMGTDYNFNSDGLKVYTTIDSRHQRYAQEAVFSMGNALQAVADCEWSARDNKLWDFGEDLDLYLNDPCHTNPNNRFAYFWERDSVFTGVQSSEDRADLTRLEAGFIALDPSSGHVKAWVGGRDIQVEEYDHVHQAKRQPGSSFKPILYATAISAGWTPESEYIDSVYTYRLPGTDWRPQNSGGKSSNKPIILREALARSLNTIAAQLIYDVDPMTVIDMAKSMGINSKLDPVLSLALGTSDVSLLEMATAYGTLANQGVMIKPVVITRITDRYGKEIYPIEDPANSQNSIVAINEESNSVVVDMMRDGINQPYGTGARIRTRFGQQGYDFAGKTGTTQEGADGWFMLMHPQLVTGSWVGFNDRRVTFRSSYWGQGSRTGLFIVGDYLRRINADSQTALDRSARFPDPQQVTIDSSGG